MRGRKPARYKLSAKDHRYLTEIATDGQLIQWIAKRARILLAFDRGEREGIKAGTPAPSFRLPDIYGRTVSLEEYRDRRVLLVFSDPHCGPCDQLAPHLVQLHWRHRANNLAVVMVGHGDPEENRRKAEAHGFEFPVVLQERWKLSKEYGIFATPVAFLIDENGVIARNVSQGTDEILALTREGLAAGKA